MIVGWLPLIDLANSYLSIRLSHFLNQSQVDHVSFKILLKASLTNAPLIFSGAVRIQRCLISPGILIEKFHFIFGTRGQTNHSIFSYR